MSAQLKPLANYSIRTDKWIHAHNRRLRKTPPPIQFWNSGFQFEHVFEYICDGFQSRQCSCPQWLIQFIDVRIELNMHSVYCGNLCLIVEAINFMYVELTPRVQCIISYFTTLYKLLTIDLDILGGKFMAYKVERNTQKKVSTVIGTQVLLIFPIIPQGNLKIN